MTLVLAAVVPGQAGLLVRAERSEARLLATDYALSRLDALGVAEAAVPGETRYRAWRVAVTVAPASLGGAPDLAVERITVRVTDRAGRTLAEVDALRPASEDGP